MPYHVPLHIRFEIDRRIRLSSDHIHWLKLNVLPIDEVYNAAKFLNRAFIILSRFFHCWIYNQTTTKFSMTRRFGRERSFESAIGWWVLFVRGTEKREKKTSEIFYLQVKIFFNNITSACIPSNRLLRSSSEYLPKTHAFKNVRIVSRCRTKR